jgi:hypothetical protein
MAIQATTKKVVPLISSSTPGPLGIVHMPRLWIKARLHSIGALPDGYYCASFGFDAALLEALHISSDEFLGYVSATLPDYQTFESWIRERGMSPEAAAATINTAVLTREKPEKRAAEDRAYVGLADASVRTGFLLNDLDDWKTLHHDIVEGHGNAPVVPAISAGTVGPLGAANLPRFWLKGVLRAIGALPPGYESDEIDQLTLGMLGIENAQVAVYLQSLPDYLAFERWLRVTAKTIDAASIAAHNETLRKRREEVLHADLRDWQNLHSCYLVRSPVEPASVMITRNSEGLP